MEKNILHNSIEDLIEKIRKKHLEIKQSGDSVSKMDKDILLANLRTLYELCSDLNNMPVEKKTPMKVETPQPVEIIESVVEEIPEPEIYTAEKTEVEISAMNEQEEVMIQSHKTPKPSPVNLFGESATITKKFPEKESLHDKIKTEDKSLASKLMKKPIKDLKAAIGINEKFIFLNELFDGNVAEYNTAVETLNTLNSYQEADEWLNKNCAGQHKWNLKNKFVKKDFHDLVQRRFL